MSLSTESSKRQRGDSAVLRPLTALDRLGVETILKRTGVFSQAEVDCALSLVDESLARPAAVDPYWCRVACDAGGRLLGYACWGRSPMTEGTYDLYWIAVDPAAQGRGVGRALLESVERDIARADARMMLIETSSRSDYAATQAFYSGSGYELEVRLREYYSPGDDKLVYVKRFGP